MGFDSSGVGDINVNNPRISIIAVVGKKRELGKDNRLLWHLPEDLVYFKKTTQNHPVIMGMKTYESIGRPLPGRINIILSHHQKYIKGCTVVDTVQDAIQEASAKDQQEIFVIGGASVYQQFIDLADRLYLTEVNESKEADSFFPNYSKYHLVKNRGFGEYGGVKYKFNIYEK